MIRIQAGKTNRINLAVLSAISEHKGILWKLQSLAQFKEDFIIKISFCEFGKILIRGPQIRSTTEFCAHKPG